MPFDPISALEEDGSTENRGPTHGEMNTENRGPTQGETWGIRQQARRLFAGILYRAGRLFVPPSSNP